MEQELELRELFAILSKRWRMIVFIFVFAVLASIVASYYIIEPVYQSSTTLLVGKPAEGSQVVIQDVQLNRQLVATYEQIAKSNIVAQEVIRELNLQMTEQQLKSQITVGQVANTEIIAISVKDHSPDRAALLANGVASAFMAKIRTIMNVDNVSIIDPASAAAMPISPRPKLNMAIAGVLGLMLGVFLCFALEFMDNTVKTPKDIEQILELPLLGVIPFYEVER